MLDNTKVSDEEALKRVIKVLNIFDIPMSVHVLNMFVNDGRFDCMVTSKQFIEIKEQAKSGKIANLNAFIDENGKTQLTTSTLSTIINDSIDKHFDVIDENIDLISNKLSERAIKRIINKLNERMSITSDKLKDI